MTKPRSRPPSARAQVPASPLRRQSIALRIDPDVLAAFRLGARKQGIGYQTLIHNVLTQAAIDQGWL